MITKFYKGIALKCALFILLFLTACTHRSSFKRDRHPSSLTIAKIDVSFAHPKVFANGIDSTYIVVKLLDEEGELISSILPHELIIDVSEELEIKPLSLKQKIYKAEIKPRIKSPSIKMQVSWLGRLSSPIVTLETTMGPIKDEMEIKEEDVGNTTIGDIEYDLGEQKVFGFHFSNIGRNKIVDVPPNPDRRLQAEIYRHFITGYPDQARQNIDFIVRDHPNRFATETMESYFMFFPRTTLPHIIYNEEGTEFDMALATGEYVRFNSESNMIVGGVMEEGPLDRSGTRFTRHYADIKYKGSGVMIRVNARATSPQTGNMETTKIDMEYGITGSVEALVLDGKSGKRCRRPKSDFWEQKDVSPILFKFPSDEALDAHLKAKCGFGLYEETKGVEASIAP